MSLDVRLAIALLVMAVALGLLNVLVLRRTAAAFGLSPRRRRILATVLAVPFAMTLAFRALGAWLPVGFMQPAVVAVSAFEAAVMGASVLLGAASLAGRIQRLFLRPSAARSRVLPASPAVSLAARAEALALPSSFDAPPDASSEASPDVALPAAPEVSRRAFVEQAVAGSALLIGSGTAGYGAIFGRHDYELSTVAMPIPGLSRGADGFTIVQLSDIHLGQCVGEGEMRAAEELVRKAKGDLIVLTGDLIDHDARYAERLGRLVRRLGEIRPVVAIPGNHDYYTGIETVLATLRAAGATVLVNEATTLLGERGGFVLAGLDDQRGEATGGGPDLGLALARVRSDAPRIVLCHNPKHFLDTAGHVALQLSGHTHGGQVNLGLRPADLVLRHGYIAGAYENKGSRLYVNRGFGTAGPAVRVGAPPEVTRIVLVSA
jgi:predicted MPP superfamily phosphohydrolase